MWSYDIPAIHRYVHTKIIMSVKESSRHTILFFHFILSGANSFGFYAVKIFRQTFSGMNPHGG